MQKVSYCDVRTVCSSLFAESKIKFPTTSERIFNITSFYSSYNHIVFIHVSMHCRHCKRNAERRGWSTHCCLRANNNSTKFSIYTSICSRISKKWGGSSVALGRSRDSSCFWTSCGSISRKTETKSLNLSELLFLGNHTGKVYLSIFFYRVLY